jgi:hypothetical protein
MMRGFDLCLPRGGAGGAGWSAGGGEAGVVGASVVIAGGIRLVGATLLRC